MEYDNLTPDQLEQLANAAFSYNRPLNLGPFILGNVMDALLCGVLLMQCGSYIGSSARDGWLLKVAVAYVVAMNLWGTAFAWAWVWDLFVRNFGTYRAFFSVTYLSWDFVINTASVFVVQTFFALRAWKILNRNRLFGIVIFVFILASLGSGLAIKILYSRYGLTIYAGKLKIPAYICLSSMVFVDVSITSTILCYILYWRGTSERTNHLLAKLVRITFESQLPPTLIAMALLAIYTVQYDSLVMVPLIWVQPKLYGISLLHTLNMRGSMTQPSVVFGTSYAAPGHTMSFRDIQISVPMTRTAQTMQSVTVIHSDAFPPGQTQLPAVPDMSKSKVIVFDEDSLTSSSGATAQIKVEVADSRSFSSDSDSDTTEGQPKLADPEQTA